MKMGYFLLSVVVTAIGINAATAATGGQKRRLQAEDFYRLQSVENPACSKDGEWIAYTVTSAMREADELRSAVWMVNWLGTERLQLTTGALSASAPQFSPDGRYVSYLAAQRADPLQLYLLDRRGGEPQLLTHVSGQISDYRWSPDSRTIVFSLSGAQVGPTEALRAPGVEASDATKPIVIDDFHFKEDVSGYLTTADRPKLYLLEVATRKMQALTSDTRYRDDHPWFGAQMDRLYS